MILVYAPGGGLGHVTRARAAVHTLGFPESDTCVMSPISHVRDRRIVGEMKSIRIPEELEHDRDGLGRWVAHVLNELRPTTFVVDAFPAGILGELCGVRIPGTMRVIHLARRLRWSTYSADMKRDLARFLRPPSSRYATRPPNDAIHRHATYFERVYRLEELEPAHDSYLRRYSTGIYDVQLRDPEIDPTESERRIIAALRDGPRPLWIVVHSGSSDEVIELVRIGATQVSRDHLPARRATDLPPAPSPQSPVPDSHVARIVVVSPHGAPHGMEHVDFYPASHLLPFADRIITAAGFNVMRQLEAYRDRHIAVPLHRRFDDQHWRAGKARRRL